MHNHQLVKIFRTGHQVIQSLPSNILCKQRNGKENFIILLKRTFRMSVCSYSESVPSPPLQAQANVSTSTSGKTSKEQAPQVSGVKLQPESLSNISSAKISSTVSQENQTLSEKVNVVTLKTNFSSVNNPQSKDENALLASRRVDPTTVRQVFYFDTLAFSKKLESRGFTREQAECVAECLLEIINTTLDHQGRHMVTKPQQEIAVQQLLSEIVVVKKDMTLLQKSEFSSLKTETEKMSIELSRIHGHMGDEIVKLKGQFSLDINLERGRAIEAHAENEKKLQQLHNKIETEIANLKTLFEIYRNDVFKYAGGTVIAVGGLILGVLRLWQ